MDYLKTIQSISDLTLRFGEVERATRHPDGRRETDTTHTVMLALACNEILPWVNGARAARGLRALSPSMVLQFAIYHDLPEAYCGDTDTSVGLSWSAALEKKINETAAIEQIRADLPGVAEMLDTYEKQNIAAAQYVRYVDKILPKVVLRSGPFHVLDARYEDVDQMCEVHDAQVTRLRQECPLVAQDLEPILHAACEALESYFADNFEAHTARGAEQEDVLREALCHVVRPMREYMVERADAGRHKYGVGLTTRNGRHALVDALQEATDLAMYLTQYNMEHPTPQSVSRRNGAFQFAEGLLFDVLDQGLDPHDPVAR